MTGAIGTSRNTRSLSAARCCSPRATMRSPPRCWRTGFCLIVCRCAFSCSSTKCCGATCPASDRRGDGVSMQSAIVLLSGGLDSATVLAIARAEGYLTFALSVDYGQRHSAELAAAHRVAHALGAHEHRVMRVDLAGIGGAALTHTPGRAPGRPHTRG